MRVSVWEVKNEGQQAQATPKRDTRLRRGKEQRPWEDACLFCFY